MKNILKTWFFRGWYWFISKTDKHAEILFMNYGYHNDDFHLQLSTEDEKNRYLIQLYHYLATKAAIASKDICEVGSGRGGGLAWIHKTFRPKSSVGVDLNQSAVNFCSQHYPMQDLRFIHGDAQSLPLGEEKFDIVLNVESSHRYQSFGTFLAEAYRILKSDGQLLLTDFRRCGEMDVLRETIHKSGFQVTHHEIITHHILKALECDDARKRDLVRRLVPKFLKNLSLNFAGATGSSTYKNFQKNYFIYFTYVLKK